MRTRNYVMQTAELAVALGAQILSHLDRDVVGHECQMFINSENLLKSRKAALP